MQSCQRAFAVLAVVTAAQASCGTDGGPLTPENFVERFRSEACNKAVACRAFPSIADCKSSLDLWEFQQALVAYEAGIVDFDPAAAQECIDRNDWCNERTLNNYLLGGIICDAAFQGPLQPGDACRLSHECDNGWCERDTCEELCCLGVCQAFGDGGIPGVGEDCWSARGQPCQADLYCQVDDLELLTGTCQTLQEPGHLCDQRWACEEGHYCANGNCLPRANRGAECSPISTASLTGREWDSPCASGKDYCDRFSRVCEPRKKEGGSCATAGDRECVLWASCHNGTCYEDSALGGFCSIERGCQGNLTCAPGGICRTFEENLCSR